MALDFTKPVQTRSGLKVTIPATEARGRFSVIGMIHEPTIDSAATWTAEGAFHADGREAPADGREAPADLEQGHDPHGFDAWGGGRVKACRITHIAPFVTPTLPGRTA